MDRVAAGGTRFGCARSPHIPTQPAHTTLWSGQDVFAHGVVAHGGAVEPPADLEWLPSLLQSAGVRTVAVDNLGRWLQRGFDAYHTYDLAAAADGFWRKGEAVTQAAEPAVATLAEAARRGEPFFGFFHFWDPHTPYCPQPPFDRLFYDGDERRADEHGLDALWAFSPFADYFAGWMPGVTDRAFPRAQYAACVRALDHAVGRLWRALGAAGCLEDTLVIVTADHGEELGEHGIWFDHHGLYETNLRVPLLLWAPGRVPRGAVVEDPVSILDLAPTVAAACGVAPPAAMGGRDLRSAWLGGLRPASALYGTECTWMRKRVWLSGRHKLISALEPDFHGGPDLELYDLSTDPGEHCNLATLRPALTDRLRTAMEAHVARRVAATGCPDPLSVQSVASRRLGAPGAGPADGGVRSEAAVSEEDRARVSERLARLGY